MLKRNYFTRNLSTFPMNSFKVQKKNISKLNALENFTAVKKLKKRIWKTM